MQTDKLSFDYYVNMSLVNSTGDKSGNTMEDVARRLNAVARSLRTMQLTDDEENEKNPEASAELRSRMGLPAQMGTPATPPGRARHRRGRPARCRLRSSLKWFSVSGRIVGLATKELARTSEQLQALF
jgi:hypothetical protein